MKSLSGIVACWILLSTHTLSVPAAFTSLSAFGDGVSPTTNSPGELAFYDAAAARFECAETRME